MVSLSADVKKKETQTQHLDGKRNKMRNIQNKILYWSTSDLLENVIYYENK